MFICFDFGKDKTRKIYGHFYAAIIHPHMLCNFFSDVLQSFGHSQFNGGEGPFNLIDCGSIIFNPISLRI